MNSVHLFSWSLFKSSCSTMKAFLKKHKTHIKNILWGNYIKKAFAGLHLKSVKKRPRHKCSPMNFTLFLRAPFSQNPYWWLLLIFAEKPHYFSLIQNKRNFISLFFKFISSSSYIYTTLSKCQKRTVIQKRKKKKNLSMLLKVAICSRDSWKTSSSLFFLFFYFFIFLIGIHSMQHWTATMRHRVTRKETQKKITGYRKSV